LFLYLLTNEHTNWCGVYELELGMMAYESGVDERDLERSFLPRLSPKIIYVDGWIYVPNWVKHHQSESGNLSPSQKKGIEEAWNKVPEKIRLKIKEIEGEGIPYAYPMVGVSASASSLSSASNAVAKPPAFEVVPVSEESEDRPTKKADPLTDKAARYWNRKCLKEVGMEPTGGLVKTKKIINDARKSLSFQQIQQMMDEWFETETKEDHDMIQITQCLSPYKIDKFKAANV